MCFECFCKAYKVPVMHGLYAFKRVKGYQIQPTQCTLFSSAEADRRFRAFIFEWKLFTEHWKNYIYSLDRDRWYVAEYAEKRLSSRVMQLPHA